ncbi:MAG: amidohydrolase family protein [Candidatus Aminicenantes bacterium]|nr:amidohydrolase family protein [Candidatus Aminicenantes bacterium]
MSLYLKNATHVDWRTLKFSSGHLRVDGGDDGGLEFIPALPADPAPGDRVLDCRDKLVTRSFACGHHHAYSALARGMPPPAHPPADFRHKLQDVWWKLDRALDPELVLLSALATALECARNGVTFVIDHHSSPNAVEGSLEAVAGAFAEVGVGVLPCLELSDRDGEAVREKGLAETGNRLAAGQPCLVGLHASFTVGDELLTQAVALASKYLTGIHVHAAEDTIDQELTFSRHGCRVVERFHEAGVLELPRTILVHGLHLDQGERALLKGSVAWLAENMESNLNNRVGFFRGEGLSSRIMLGTDGLHSDMIQSARAAYFGGIDAERAEMADVYCRLRRVHDYLHENGVGGDGENNLVILDYPSPTPVSEENFLTHFFYGLGSRHVDSVIARGRLIVENRRVLTVNEEEVLALTRAGAARLWKRLAQ